MNQYVETQSGCMQTFEPPAILGDRLELQLFTTLTCNLGCRYCSEADGDVRGTTTPVSYSLDELAAFVSRQACDREVVVTFYGGEPLLNMEFLTEVMARFPLWRYQLQTNGTLLDRLPPAVLGQFRNILVSIDGHQAATDTFRGEGTHARVLANVLKVRPHVRGSITARMTWAYDATNKQDFDFLLERFDYVYFQLAHRDWVYTDAYMRNARQTLTALVERFVQPGPLYPVVPLMGVARGLLFPSRARELYAGRTQCRVSSHLLNVLPSGRIVGCPDMAYRKDMEHGCIQTNSLQPNPLQRRPEMPCAACRAFGYCRSNCLKGLHRAYIDGDEAYRRKAVEPCCELIKFIGDAFQKQDLAAWYAALSLADRRLLTDCEVYEYVEIMP